MHNRAEGGISADNAVDDVRRQRHGMFAGCCHACGLQEVDRKMLKRSVWQGATIKVAVPTTCEPHVHVGIEIRLLNNV